MCHRDAGEQSRCHTPYIPLVLPLAIYQVPVSPQTLQQPQIATEVCLSLSTSHLRWVSLRHGRAHLPTGSTHKVSSGSILWCMNPLTTLFIQNRGIGWPVVPMACLTTRMSEVMTALGCLDLCMLKMTSLVLIQRPAFLFHPYRNHWMHSLVTSGHSILLDTRTRLV